HPRAGWGVIARPGGVAGNPSPLRCPRGSCMIRSMTGFGDASAQVDGVHYVVEVRSLNNKFFKPTLRLPDLIAGLEAELEAALRRRVSRGSVTLTVKLRISDAHAASRVNEPALLAYLNHLETIH